MATGPGAREKGGRTGFIRWLGNLVGVHMVRARTKLCADNLANEVENCCYKKIERSTKIMTESFVVVEAGLWDFAF